MTLAEDDCPTAVAGHDIPWGLRDITRAAARNLDENSAALWGNGRAIQRIRRVIADWCASHVSLIGVVETENVRVLRFSSTADLLVFRLRWL